MSAETKSESEQESETFSQGSVEQRVEEMREEEKRDVKTPEVKKLESPPPTDEAKAREVLTKVKAFGSKIVEKTRPAFEKIGEKTIETTGNAIKATGRATVRFAKSLPKAAKRHAQRARTRAIQPARITRLPQRYIPTKPIARKPLFGPPSKPPVFFNKQRTPLFAWKTSKPKTNVKRGFKWF